MRVKESEIDAMARHLVEGLIARGSIAAKTDADALVACVVEIMSANFETAAQIEEQAAEMAEAEARKNPGLDANRLRSMIRQRLAEKRNFTI